MYAGRPDVLGVEMKTLPVKPHSGPPITGASIAPAATRVYTPHEFRTSGSKTPGGSRAQRHTHTRDEHIVAHGTRTQSQTAPTTKPVYMHNTVPFKNTRAEPRHTHGITVRAYLYFLSQNITHL